jgi:hypothetical protein
MTLGKAGSDDGGRMELDQDRVKSGGGGFNICGDEASESAIKMLI